MPASKAAVLEIVAKLMKAAVSTISAMIATLAVYMESAWTLHGASRLLICQIKIYRYPLADRGKRSRTPDDAICSEVEFLSWYEIIPLTESSYVFTRYKIYSR